MPEVFAAEAIVALVVSSLVSCTVGAIVGAVVTFIGKSKDKHDHEGEIAKAEQAALIKGVRTLLRNEIVSMHREYAEENGYITLEALEYAEDTYMAYHDLNGNGSGTKLWHDIKALPVKE